MKARQGDAADSKLETGDPREADALSAEENADLCSGCVKCCTYITVEIDPPRAAWEYDQWIWALHHASINLYVETPERWFLHVDTVCERLNADGRCSIYGRHPVLCRHYDPRSCERRLPLGGIRAWFHEAHEFESWIRTHRPRHWERLMSYRRDTAAPGSALISIEPLVRSAARDEPKALRASSSSTSRSR